MSIFEHFSYFEWCIRMLKSEWFGINLRFERMKLAPWIVHRRWWQHLLFGLAVIIAIGRTGINKSITISRNAVEWYAEAYSKFHNFRILFWVDIFFNYHNFKRSIKPTSDRTIDYGCFNCLNQSLWKFFDSECFSV